MRKSRYNIVHALAATALLLYVVLHFGFAAFWRVFLHGLDIPMTPQVVLQNFRDTALLFGTLWLVLWASTLFSKLPSDRRDGAPAPERLKAVGLAARWSPVLIGVAIGLNLLCAACIEWITGVQPSDQELVKCLSGDACSTSVRIMLAMLVLFEAPLVEEPLFRGVMFRGFASSLPTWAAMALSGFLFALVHVNAASFIPLWFLGVAFAELYRRTGTILAPMTAHALFNAANLALLPFIQA